MSTNSAVIVVPTYMRNAWLDDLLTELQKQVCGYPLVEIMVVDNSEDGRAEPVCTGSSKVRYVHEPRPGIVAARNRALREIGTLEPQVEFVVFIDDDELPAPGWLQTLLDAPERHQADAAIGPVQPILPPVAPKALVRGGFFERIHLKTGETPPWGTTNNTIVRMAAIRSLADPGFDEAFSSTGGSDADLFWRLARSGFRMVWIEEALVYERFSPARANWKWISKRNIRLGNVSARLKLRETNRYIVFALGIARIGFGLGTGAAKLAITRSIDSRAHSHVFKGIGMVGEVLGRRVHEYERKKAHG